VLERQLEFFIEKTHYLEDKMSDLEQLDTDLRGLLEGDPALKESIEKEDDSTDAIKSEVSPINEPRIFLSSRGNMERERALRQIQLLEQKIPDQEQSLEELKDAVIQRTDRLVHTPTLYPVQGKIKECQGDGVIDNTFNLSYCRFGGVFYAASCSEKSKSGIYHIMMRGINRQCIFQDEDDCLKFIRTIQDYKEISGYEVYAYC
jgi:hypothetical protein